MRYYDSFIDSKGLTYSCDMIRLKFEYKSVIEYELLSQLDSIKTSYDLGVDVQEYTSFKGSGFRHLLVYKSSDRFQGFDLSYSFSIGVRHNMDTDKNSMTGFIEFNPNKCDIGVVSKYMSIIRMYSNYLGNGFYFDLIRYDMGIDIKVPRYALKLIKEGKRIYQYIQSSSLTEYLGVRHTNGYTKLYDKREENKLDYDLTRLEVTCVDIDSVTLPRVAYASGQYDLDFGLNDTDFVLVSLIRQQDEQQQQYYLSKLGRGKREKLRPYIIGGSSILEYDKKGIMHVQDIVQRAMRINL